MCLWFKMTAYPVIYKKESVHLIPKFIVSEVPIIPIARSMLLQILAACNKMTAF